MNNFNYQNQALEKLSKLKAGILFMSMGTGKTKVAINLAISRQNDFDCIVWIAPASLIRSRLYLNEINKWSDNLTKPIYYFTIEGVSSSDVKYLEMINLAKDKQSFCIVDESITIKNLIAKRTARLLQNWHLFKFRLILNGTPITKGLIDLYSQINFISPNILSMTESQFANNFLQYKKDGWRSYARWSLPFNEQALIEKIKPYIFNADLDLETKINNFEYYFDLSEDERSDYESYKIQILNNTKNILDFLAISQKLQQKYTICDKKNSTLKLIVNQILSKKQKVIIYVKFLSEINLIKEIFNDVALLSGCNKSGLEQFIKDKDILVATYGTGSLGHNLQFCNNIIYFSQTFDYKQKEQSLHRIYRAGQKQDCNIYNFYIKTGLEEIIIKSLKKKRICLSNIKQYIEQSKEQSLQPAP